MTRSITQLLQKSQDGDENALQQLTPIIYQELKRLARASFGGEGFAHTLQPTALLNEAYEKLFDIDIEWQDRKHFFALASRMMRRILIDHAKKNHSQKRGGDVIHTSFKDEQTTSITTDQALLDLDEALVKLKKHDPRKAKIIELSYFGGLTYNEVAEYLQISSATVHRDLRMAEAWLKHNLSNAMR